MTTEIEKITVLHNSDWSLQIGESADSPNHIEIRTWDKRGEDWFGKFAIAFEAKDARLLGEALIEHALLKGE